MHTTLTHGMTCFDIQSPRCIHTHTSTRKACTRGPIVLRCRPEMTIAMYRVTRALCKRAIGACSFSFRMRC